ncbi:MAG: DUF3253 domain-containing protein [Chloroflexi bacterium]|nr:DUF3253 domain-containing protein [Chloroflexota bacterium]
MARGKKKRKISDELIVETILQLCAAAGEDSAVRPEDIAREIYTEEWQTMLSRVRLTARQLADAGHVHIMRKGEPVDPNDFKGLYRIRITSAFFEPADEIEE